MRSYLLLLPLVAILVAVGPDAPATAQEKPSAERPPVLDCTGEKGADAATVLASQKAWAKFLGEASHEKAFALDKAGKVKVEMVLLPPGKYSRGSPEGKGGADERPQKVITLTKPLWVGKDEVTQAQYVAVMGAAPKGGFAFKKEGAEAEKYPAENVSHDEAVEFCKKAEGANFRLLTEAEWEHAYRGGTRTKWYNGDDEKKVGDIAQFEGNNNKATTEKGSKAANAFGLSDMAGNVWEWCSDWYDAEYYAKSATENPTGPENGSFRVDRGGSWSTLAWGCRAAFRFRYSPGDRSSILGFRLAVVASAAK